MRHKANSIEGQRPPAVLPIATAAMTPDLDPMKSRERLGELIIEAKSRRQDLRLILFGEATLGWFHKKGESAAYHQRIAETIPGPTTDYVAGLAREHDLCVSFGLSERRGKQVHNSQVLIDPAGEIVATHRKFWMRSPAFCAAERRLTLADVDGVRVAILICADARSLWLMRAIRRARPDIVLASLADYGTDLRLNRMMGAFYDAWNVVANRCSEEPPLVWPGLVTITDPWARMRAHEVGKEQVLHFRIPIVRPRAIGRLARRVYVFFRLIALVFGFAAASLGRSLTKRMRSRSATCWLILHRLGQLDFALQVLA